MAGTCAIPRLSSRVKHLGDQPNAVGSRRPCCQRSGRARPSTLALASKTVVVSRSEEMCARHAPRVVPLDAPSPTLRTIELASDRSAETWHAPGAKRDAPLLHRLGMASERGLGLVAGSRAACEEALGGGDDGQALRALFPVPHPWENTASAALGQDAEAAPTCAPATRASHRATRLQPEAPAYHACEPALARDDPRTMLRALLRATFPWGSPQGTRRPVAGGRSAVTRLVPRSAARAGAPLPHALPTQASASCRSLRPCAARCSDAGTTPGRRASAGWRGSRGGWAPGAVRRSRSRPANAVPSQGTRSRAGGRCRAPWRRGCTAHSGGVCAAHRHGPSLLTGRDGPGLPPALSHAWPGPQPPRGSPSDHGGPPPSS